MERPRPLEARFGFPSCRELPSSCSEARRHCRCVGEFRKRRSEEHTSELQSRLNLVCRLLLEKKKKHYPTLRHSSSPLRFSRAHPPAGEPPDCVIPVSDTTFQVARILLTHSGHIVSTSTAARE